jgi:hypothetical protein
MAASSSSGSIGYGGPGRFGALSAGQYFEVRRDGPGFSTRGEASVFIGHSLPGGSANRPDGAWLRWHWDGRELTVEGDRYGLIPAYYALDAHGFALSTSIHRLLEEGVSAEPDEEALAVFLRCGVFLGEDTPFRAIRALPPGGHYVWRGEAVPPVATLPLATALTGMSRDAALERFADLMRDAIARRSEAVGDCAVALSGGMDSRHILLELCRLGRRPRFTVTARAYRGMPSRDVDIARSISESLGIPHRIIDQDEDWLALELRRNVRTHYCTLEHDWSIPIAEQLGPDAGVVHDGIGGDVFTDCRSITTEWRLAAFRDGRFDELAAEFLGHKAAPRHFLAPEFRERCSWERAVARASREFARFAAAPNPPAAFWFWNRTRRVVALAPFGVWQRAFHVLAPYLDEQVFDFMASLPAEMVGDYGFHADSLAREFPAFAQVGYFSEANPAPPVGWPGYRQMAAQALRHLLRQPRGRLLSRGYVLPRLGWALVDARYCRESAWLPSLAVYLSQLEAGRHADENRRRTSSTKRRSTSQITDA